MKDIVDETMAIVETLRRKRVSLSSLIADGTIVLDMESGPDRSKRKRTEWVPQFEKAIGTRTGTAKHRHNFATEIVDTLDVMGPFAILMKRVTAAPDNKKRLEEIIRDFDHLRSKIEAYDVRILDNLIDFDAVSKQLRLVSFTEGFTAAGAPPKKRGPQNTLGVEVAETIALIYYRNLGRWPSAHRRETGRINSPYDRVCEVAELFLGHLNLRLGDRTRMKGVHNAKTNYKELTIAVPPGWTVLNGTQ